jgi:CheY-like chemotaxis protein
MSADPTSAPRLLLVEDVYMVAATVRSQFEALGCGVLDPLPSVEAALEAIDQLEFDGALLDIDLGGQSVLPVVERLKELNKPFVIVTGYSSPEKLLPDVDRELCFFKPLVRDEMLRALRVLGFKTPE